MVQKVVPNYFKEEKCLTGFCLVIPGLSEIPAWIGKRDFDLLKVVIFGTVL